MGDQGAHLSTKASKPSPSQFVISVPSKQVISLEQLNISIPDDIRHPPLPSLNHVSGIVDGNDTSKCLPSISKSWQASLATSASNYCNIPKNNCVNLPDNNIDPDGEPLETNEPIQLMNKFDSPLSEELI